MRSKETRRFVVIFAASALATFVALVSSRASAYWEEVPPHACHGMPFGTSLYCPFQGDTTHPFTAATDLKVYGKNVVANGITASACVSAVNSVLTFCGTPKSTSGTGWKILHPSLSQWQAGPAGIAYVKETLAGASVYSGYAVAF
jgi:hypothetical protein